MLYNAHPEFYTEDLDHSPRGPWFVKAHETPALLKLNSLVSGWMGECLRGPLYAAISIIKKKTMADSTMLGLYILM